MQFIGSTIALFLFFFGITYSLHRAHSHWKQWRKSVYLENLTPLEHARRLLMIAQSDLDAATAAFTAATTSVEAATTAITAFVANPPANTLDGTGLATATAALATASSGLTAAVATLPAQTPE